MADPSKILPREPKGDDSPEQLYREVGYALTEWERLQAVLMDLFCNLVKGDQIVLGRAFGTLKTPIPRVEMIEAVANARYLTRMWGKKTNQHLEPTKEKILNLTKRVKGLNERRNDIAHGTVVRHSFNGVLLGYYLDPRDTMTAKYDVGKDPPAAYMWTAKQVRHYADEFTKLRGTAQEVRKLVRETKP